MLLWFYKIKFVSFLPKRLISRKSSVCVYIKRYLSKRKLICYGFIKIQQMEMKIDWASNEMIDSRFQIMKRTSKTLVDHNLLKVKQGQNCKCN